MKRKKFRRKADIEPVIGHFKKEFRMDQNYLAGEKSPQKNTFLAGTGWNLKKMMKKLKQKLLWLFFSFWEKVNLLQNKKQIALNLG